MANSEIVCTNVLDGFIQIELPKGARNVLCSGSVVVGALSSTDCDDARDSSVFRYNQTFNLHEVWNQTVNILEVFLIVFRIKMM